MAMDSAEDKKDNTKQHEVTFLNSIINILYA